MPVIYSLAAKTARMTAARNQIDGGLGAGKLEIGTTSMAEVLVTVLLNDPSGTVANDILSLSGFPKYAMPTRNGIAASARIRDSSNNDIITGLTVGVDAESFDIVVDDTSVIIDHEITVNATPTIIHAP